MLSYATEGFSKWPWPAFVESIFYLQLSFYKRVVHISYNSDISLFYYILSTKRGILPLFWAYIFIFTSSSPWGQIGFNSTLICYVWRALSPPGVLPHCSDCRAYGSILSVNTIVMMMLVIMVMTMMMMIMVMISIAQTAVHTAPSYL